MLTIERLLFSLILFSFLSCSDNEPDVTIKETYELEVSVDYCSDPTCSSLLPHIPIKVELFSTYENAVAQESVLEWAFTSNEGRVAFDELSIGLVYLRVESEKYGTYISSENLNNASPQLHSIKFIQDHVYDNDSIPEYVQAHISFTKPRVGQQSNYRYHQNNNLISFTPTEHSDVWLRVRIMDQLSESSFLIEESIDSIYGILSVPFYPQTEVVRSLWRFENDSLYVLPYEDEYFGSYVWNLGGYLEPHGDGFSLIKTLDYTIDMDTDFVAELQGKWGTGYAEDFLLFDHLYEELLVNHVSYNATDGPIKFRVYNKADGLVRSMDFYAGGSVTTHGFDLVLE